MSEDTVKDLAAALKSIMGTIPQQPLLQEQAPGFMAQQQQQQMPGAVAPVSWSVPVVIQTQSGEATIQLSFAGNTLPQCQQIIAMLQQQGFAVRIYGGNGGGGYNNGGGYSGGGYGGGGYRRNYYGGGYQRRY
ncbi:MAG: hypothetical protein LBG46_03140 [Elusimicrobiota bacterium]|nr:hypothetical protein [Elusimicrobiota bacterium]